MVGHFNVMLSRFDYSFPGILPDDNLLGLLKLMALEIDPDTGITTQIALDGGYDPCGTSSGNFEGKKLFKR